jgi:LmeA-like phospholipid-binding
MRRIAAMLATLVLIVVLLAVAQLVLPGIAAQILRDRLSRSGKVIGVEVDAFPAIELLWQHADKVVIRMQQYRSNPSNLGSMLSQAGDVGTLEASAGKVESGLLTLRDVTLRKRGNQLAGSARVTDADLRAALPILDSVQLVATGAGQLTLRGTATLLGVTATIDATVRAQDGQIVVQPDVPLGGLATISVFSSPHLAVSAVGASAAPGGFAVSATGQLR